MGQDLDELVAEHRLAERSLRGALLGDGVYSGGAVRGEEARTVVGNRLRRLHATFEEAVRVARARQERVDALEAELRARRRPVARRARKPPAAKSTTSAPAPKTPARKTKP